jgi:hypothetical protein
MGAVGGASTMLPSLMLESVNWERADTSTWMQVGNATMSAFTGDGNPNTYMAMHFGFEQQLRNATDGFRDLAQGYAIRIWVEWSGLTDYCY